MFERLTTALAIAVIALGISATSGLAQDEKATEMDVAAATTEINLGRQILDYGMKEGDALSIVNGVRLMKNAGGDVLGDGEEKPGGKGFDFEAALNKAASLAKGDELITKLIDATKADVAKESKWARRCWWRYWCYGGYCWYRWWCRTYF